MTNLTTISEIFKDKFFIVPDFQRGYSWESEQLEDLINDIENLKNREHKHYTGTIVMVQSNDNIQTLEIIDGQQRLTTIVMLISAIYFSNPVKYKDLLSSFLRRGELGNRKLVLQPNVETAAIFSKLIIENEEGENLEIKSDVNVANAKKIISKWIKKRKNSLDLYLDVILNKLGFIFYLTENDKEIGIMFEVINNRGKELSELEKIKNYFIYYASIYDLNELRKAINDNWIIIQKNLNKAEKITNDDEGSFILYNYLVFYQAEKISIDEIYHKIKDEYDPNRRNPLIAKNHNEKIFEFLKLLTTSSKHYAYIFNENHFESDYNGEYKIELSKILKKLRCQPTIATVMPLILSVMARENDMKKKVELLEIIEKVNFRMYILPFIVSRADHKKNLFYKWANEFYNKFDITVSEITEFNNKKVTGRYSDLLKENLKQVTKYFCNGEKFIESMQLSPDDNFSFYGWSGLRYFLACYEEHLQKANRKTWDIQNILRSKNDKKNQSNDVLTKEHIWAEDNRKEHYNKNEHEKNRLGNFVLLGSGDNSSLSNGDILDKFSNLNTWIKTNKAGMELKQVNELPEILFEAEKYLKKQLKRKIQTHVYYKELACRINDIRETKLIEFALKNWAFIGERIYLDKEVNSFK
jgi:uncharacterized protein with ParB-like and HNH nuclease domain